MEINLPEDYLELNSELTRDLLDSAGFDHLNDNIRSGHLKKDEVDILDDLVDRLDRAVPLTGLVLYRGLDNFSPSYLTDPGITFKTLSREYALTYGPVLLVCTYPSETNQLYLEEIVPGEFAMISYPGEIFRLVHHHTENNIDIYEVEFVGLQYPDREYHLLFDPVKERLISKLKREMNQKIRSNQSMIFNLHHPLETVEVKPGKSASATLANHLSKIETWVYENRIV